MLMKALGAARESPTIERLSLPTPRQEGAEGDVCQVFLVPTRADRATDSQSRQEKLGRRLLSLRDPLREFQEKQDVLRSILHRATQSSHFAEELLGSFK